MLHPERIACLRRASSSASTWAPPTAPSPTSIPAAGDTPRVRGACPSRRSCSPGVVEDRPLLPSFLYLPGPNEQPAGQPEAALGRGPRLLRRRVRPQLRLAGADAARVVAPSRGCATPASIAGPPILPWKAPEDGRKVSPLEASTRYLKHLAEAWNARGREGRGRAPAGTAGHHPDRAGVVRRRRPRADRRGGPRRGVREPDAARRAAGRVLRLARRLRRRLARAGRGRRR